MAIVCYRSIQLKLLTKLCYSVPTFMRLSISRDHQFFWLLLVIVDQQHSCLNLTQAGIASLKSTAGVSSVLPNVVVSNVSVIYEYLAPKKVFILALNAWFENAGLNSY